MSFQCDFCGYQNNEIQSGSQVQEQGVSYKVKIQTAEDLSRQIVKSDYATFTVPEIDLEIPPSSQKGGKKSCSKKVQIRYGWTDMKLVKLETVSSIIPSNL